MSDREFQRRIDEALADPDHIRGTLRLEAYAAELRAEAMAQADRAAKIRRDFLEKYAQREVDQIGALLIRVANQ